ncbi:MAG: NUDIX domain-containing protein [Candidatus Kerfeldbacteria bacterium]
MKQLVAMKAFLVYRGNVLIVRESAKNPDGTNAGKYDVVGGRVKPGERFDETLKREIHEETGIDAQLGKPFFVGEWRPVVRGEEWQIIATFFSCTSPTERVTLSRDHDEYQWIDPIHYHEYPLIDNLAPVFEAYNVWHKKRTNSV